DLEELVSVVTHKTYHSGTNSHFRFRSNFAARNSFAFGLGGFSSNSKTRRLSRSESSRRSASSITSLAAFVLYTFKSYDNSPRLKLCASIAYKAEMPPSIVLRRSPWSACTGKHDTLSAEVLEMLPRGSAKKVTIYVNQDTRAHVEPLWSAILTFLRSRHVAGATLF